MIKKATIDKIRYSILFSCLFISIGQFFFWFSYLILPFILFGFRLKKKDDIPTWNLFNLYILLALLVLLTGLVGIGIVYPIKRFLEMVSCIICSYLIYINIQRSGNCIPLFQGIFIASIVLSAFLLYFHMDISSFSLVFEDVEIGPGKNNSAMHLFAGLFSAVCLRDAMKKNGLLFLFGGTVFFLLIVMTLSLKTIIAALPFEFLLLYHAFRDRKSNKIIITALLIFLYSIRDVLGEFYETASMNLVFSRMLTLIGLEKYADIQALGFVDRREELMSNAIDIFMNSPICGIGLENTRLVMGTYSHNTYVELAAGAGIFAPFIFAVLVVLCLYYLWRIPKSSWHIYSYMYIMMIAIVFANSLKVYSVHEAIIFFILLPYIIRLHNKHIVI